MDIRIAKTAGFCFGVKRAVDIAFEVAAKSRGGVYTLGPIIHNPQVIAELEAAGVRPVESVGDLKGKAVKAVIIRTHGVPLDVQSKLKRTGFRVIDATCPFVKKAQHYAKLLREEGYRVVILGDSHHPEVKGLMSYAGGAAAGKGAIVVRDAGDLAAFKGKAGVVVQTTQRIDILKGLIDRLIELAKEVKVYNTICSSTALRLRETEDMAREADIMIIVGGKNSANTTQLANLSRSLSVPTYHIETAAELRLDWFSRAGRVGITAGASTPHWIIEEVKKKVKRTRSAPRGRSLGAVPPRGRGPRGLAKG